MNTAYFNHITCTRSVDHLTTSDIDARVMRVDANIAWLRIAHARPSLDGARGAPVAAHFARKAVANQTRAVEAVRTCCAPTIRLAQLGVCTINNNVARYRLGLRVIRWL